MNSTMDKWSKTNYFDDGGCASQILLWDLIDSFYLFIRLGWKVDDNFTFTPNSSKSDFQNLNVN
jgi:hypothetical protein